MYDAANPDMFRILEEDDSLPLDPETRRVWITNCRSPLRLGILPLLRLCASTLLYLIYLVKRALPFQFSDHARLQTTINWFMRHFVSPEANYLILRHFWTESNILNFIIRNSNRRDTPLVDLYPYDIDDMSTMSFVAHDVALYNTFHQLGPTDVETWPVPRDKLDFSGMRPIAVSYRPGERRGTQILDFATAHELFKTLFCLLVTAEEYERSINSFQLDHSMVLRIARIMSAPEVVDFTGNKYPLVLVGPGDLTYRFTLHGMFTEHMQAWLERAVSLLILPYYVLVALGVSLGYHRGMAHNSIRCRPWFRRVLVFLGLPAGPPVAWAGAHRYHHLHTDDPEDLHSPVQDGLWYAHCGWYLQTHNRAATVAYALAGPLRLVYDAWLRPVDAHGQAHRAPDIAADPWIRFMSTRIGYALCSAPHLLPCWAAWRLGGVQGLLLVYVAQILLYNSGDAVNSLGHAWGEQRYVRGQDASRNNRLLALLTMGDGWHNNHHACPTSARHGLTPGEFDLAWLCIQRFHACGWIESYRLR